MLKYYIATGETETDILAEYGVHVSGSTGLIGRPDFKTPKKYNWDYLNGEWIDLRKRRYKPREIKLKCWIKASNEQDAINKMNSFMKAFNQDKLVRLRVEFVMNSNQQSVNPVTRGLFYLVYIAKHDQPKHKWKQGKQIISFEVNLTEPSPIKRVFQVSGTDVGTVTIAYTSESEFDVHWGDGDVEYDCVGTGDVEHTYESAARHFIIITGVISDISAMELRASTNEIIITQIYDEI